MWLDRLPHSLDRGQCEAKQPATLSPQSSISRKWWLPACWLARLVRSQERPGCLLREARASTPPGPGRLAPPACPSPSGSVLCVCLRKSWIQTRAPGGCPGLCLPDLKSPHWMMGRASLPAHLRAGHLVIHLLTGTCPTPLGAQHGARWAEGAPALMKIVP